MSVNYLINIFGGLISGFIPYLWFLFLDLVITKGLGMKGQDIPDKYLGTSGQIPKT